MFSLATRHYYNQARKNLYLEARDFCGPDGHAVDNEIARAAIADARTVHPEFARFLDVTQPDGAAVPYGGKVLKTIKGMGTIYDWRPSPWTPSNGGKIPLLLFVQHIPVVPNMVGIADFIRLRDVLVAQGLMVQHATDNVGNVALYTPSNHLCYQARGANQFSCGTEHMHMSTGEGWSKKQLRASAWLIQHVNTAYGTPVGIADLASGDGVCRVLHRGQTSHRAVSDYARYFDRQDPGGGYDWEYVRHCVNFFKLHSHFEGA